MLSDQKQYNDGYDYVMNKKHKKHNDQKNDIRIFVAIFDLPTYPYPIFFYTRDWFR